jgi:hypothetical protein
MKAVRPPTPRPKSSSKATRKKMPKLSTPKPARPAKGSSRLIKFATPLLKRIVFNKDEAPVKVAKKRRFHLYLNKGSAL